MSDQDNDQETSNKGNNAKTLEEKVRLVQERARQEGFVSDGKNDKLTMDESWGEGS